MKISAGILILVWGLLIVQPAFAWFGGTSAYGSCSKKSDTPPICSKKKSTTSSCSKSKQTGTGCSGKGSGNTSKSGSKKECNTNGCNPTVGCSAGNFYIHQYSRIIIASWITRKQKSVVTDDKRILKNMSECWHPPEAWS